VTEAVGTFSVPEWRLLVAAGEPVAGCSTFAFTPRAGGPLAAGSSPYAVEVRDNGLNSTGTYTILAQCSGGAAAHDTTPFVAPDMPTSKLIVAASAFDAPPANTRTNH